MPDSATYAVRMARPADCDEVAAMTRELARDTGAGVVPKVTGDGLRTELFAGEPLLRLLVAEGASGLAGYCLGLWLYSTWRGCRGLHVIDLYVRGEARHLRLGERLLRQLVADGLAQGAGFVRLEVERGNVGAERFYQRLGFRRKDNEVHYSLDPELMQELAVGVARQSR